MAGRQPSATASIWYTLMAGRVIEARALMSMKPRPAATQCWISASGSRQSAMPADATTKVRPVPHRGQQGHGEGSYDGQQLARGHQSADQRRGHARARVQVHVEKGR